MTTSNIRISSTNQSGEMALANSPEASWQRLYMLGGAAALLLILVGVIEILVTFLPGGARIAPDSMTVGDWFTLYQDNVFMGLRNLGLLNIFLTVLGVPLFLALFGALRRRHPATAGLALIAFFLGTAVFLANNAAFPMLTLSRQYAAAADEAQRAQLLAAGQSLLAVGESHSPGSFLGFFLSEVAGLIMSGLILRSPIFGKAAAYAGLAGFGLLILFDVCSAFVPSLFDLGMALALGGGLLSMAWYFLVARRLIQLGREAG